MGLFDSSRALLVIQTSVAVLTCKRFGHRRVSTPALPRSLAGSRPERNLRLLRCGLREHRRSESGQRWLRGTSYRGDGVSAIYREAQLSRVDSGGVLVHIDPFDPYERVTSQSQTPVELAAWLARAGYRLFYWYGYDGVERRGWAHGEISRLVPGVNLWCGEVLMPACLVYPERTGAWGCGVVLAKYDKLGGAGLRATGARARGNQRDGCSGKQRSAPIDISGYDLNQSPT